MECELVKYHYRFTDKQWRELSARERAVKQAVFRIVAETPELRGF